MGWNRVINCRYHWGRIHPYILSYTHWGTGDFVEETGLFRNNANWNLRWTTSDQQSDSTALMFPLFSPFEVLDNDNYPYGNAHAFEVSSVKVLRNVCFDATLDFLSWPKFEENVVPGYFGFHVEVLIWRWNSAHPNRERCIVYERDFVSKIDGVDNISFRFPYDVILYPQDSFVCNVRVEGGGTGSVTGATRGWTFCGQCTYETVNDMKQPFVQSPD